MCNFSMYFNPNNGDNRSVMKIPLIFLSMALAAFQTISATPQQTFTRVVERGSNHKVVEVVRPVSGRFGFVTNSYTVLQNGMNYQDADGNWVESQPVVQSFPGGIICAGASYQVIVGTNLNTAG